MPELPEVQTIIDDLKKEGLIGRTIQKVNVYWPKTVAAPNLPSFIHQLRNKRIIGLSRRGKFLIFHLSEGFDLIIHLRMTGRLLLTSASSPDSPYHRLVLELDQGQQLRYHDTRKFGRWYLVEQGHSLFARLGPEPLDPDFTFALFKTSLANKKRALKPLLLDQTFLAGLGNIYVDEALWEAKLHPLRQAQTLNAQETKALYDSILYVLKRGVESQGTTLGKGRTNYYRLNGQRGGHQHHLQVFRRTGQPCSRCGHLIERMVVVQRGTHLCPHCQVLER